MDKPKRGRPATGQMPKVNFRLHPSHIETLTAQAAEAGVKPSEYLRHIVVCGIQRAAKNAAKIKRQSNA